MSPGIPVEERLVAVESSLAHLQHDYEQLHEVMLAMQTELRTLRLGMEKLRSQLERAAEAPEVRSPELERPPHY